MSSHWSHLKDEAIRLRKGGMSVRKVEARLGIPRSTLSGWFQAVTLSVKQQDKLHNDWMKSLERGRKKAVVWHNTQKKERIKLAESAAKEVLSKIHSTDPLVIELTLAILYLGEGSKRQPRLSLGSSDPLILRFFIAALRKVYGVDVSKMRADLYLRADQDPAELKKYWSRTLALPLKNFVYASNDKRTRDSKTYSNYKGVCTLTYGGTAIQRRLVFLSRLFCSKVATDH